VLSDAQVRERVKGVRPLDVNNLAVVLAFARRVLPGAWR
jgi:hypothetical protein